MDFHSIEILLLIPLVDVYPAVVEHLGYILKGIKRKSLQVFLSTHEPSIIRRVSVDSKFFMAICSA